MKSLLPSTHQSLTSSIGMRSMTKLIQDNNVQGAAYTFLIAANSSTLKQICSCKGLEHDEDSSASLHRPAFPTNDDQARHFPQIYFTQNIGADLTSICQPNRGIQHRPELLRCHTCSFDNCFQKQRPHPVKH